MKIKHIKILWRILNVLFYDLNLPSIRPLIKFLSKRIKNCGINHTIVYWKRVRLHCTRYICGQPLLTNNISIGLDKDGWPKLLKDFKNLSSIKELKFLFTLLNFTRSWELSKKEWNKVPIDFSTITDHPKGDLIIPSGVINKFVKEFKLKSSIPPFSKTENVFLSTKAGPQGPATISARSNLLNFDYYSMQRLFNLTNKEGEDFFIQNYNHVFENHKEYQPKHPYLGKISYVRDPEAKLRVIAISDYFTQLFLRPIHNITMNLLKTRFKDCDRAFTQDPKHKWLSNEHKFWSLDLSSATDRFPIKLQERLMCRIFDTTISQSWMKILRERRFKVPEAHGAPEDVQYNTGQPMGTYSSWSVFSLTHHLVVYYCAQLCGKSNFNQYIILGDDIVIKDDEVAKMYIKVITKLGVPISEQKTHVSEEIYEFAKRWIRFNGKYQELTGLPTRGIISNIKNPYIVFTILYDYFMIKENIRLSDQSLVNVINSLYKGLTFNKLLPYKNGLYIKKSPNGNRLMLNNLTKSRIRSFNLMLNVVFGRASQRDVRDLFVEKVTNPLYMLPNERVALLELRRILSNGVIKMVYRLNESIIDRPKAFVKRFGVEDYNVLNFNPLFLAVYNTTMRLKDITKSWNEVTDLHNVAKDIVDLNIDNIFNKDRNKIQSLVVVGKILENGFKVLNETDEIYYGSSTIEDTYSHKGFEKVIASNFDVSLYKEILKGEWKKPEEAPVNPWAAFAAEFESK